MSTFKKHRIEKRASQKNTSRRKTIKQNNASIKNPFVAPTAAVDPFAAPANDTCWSNAVWKQCYN